MDEFNRSSKLMLDNRPVIAAIGLEQTTTRLDQPLRSRSSTWKTCSDQGFLLNSR